MIRNSARWRLIVVVLGAFGCANAPAPVDRHFRLETVKPAAVLETPGIAGTLIVDRPRGDALAEALDAFVADVATRTTREGLLPVPVKASLEY